MTDAARPGEILAHLPPPHQASLALTLELGHLGWPPTAQDVRAALALDDADAAAVAGALAYFHESGMDQRAAGVWLRTLREALRSRDKPDLVWSGPEAVGLHARDTRIVYEELFDSAERSILVSTFAYFDGPKAFARLSQRLDALAPLQVVLILNIHRRYGDTSQPQQIVSGFALQFWKEWPGTRLPKVYYFPDSLEMKTPGAVLHAKAVVVDSARALVTSANLTASAFDRNIELGVLIRDRAIARTIEGYFRNLIDQKLLVPLPGG